MLLITFSFPPAGGVGVLRALSLAKYLPDEGIRVDVLTARNAPAVGRDDSLLKQVPSKVRVHRTWTLDLPFALRKAIKSFLAKRFEAPQGESEPATPRKKRGLGGLGRAIADLLLPDPQVGWLPFAFLAAKRIVRQRKIDLVLITVPPFSSVRLVTRLRKVFPTLPIVLDFRDEWLSTTINLVSFNRNARARAVASQCEREGVRDATSVVSVTQAAQAELTHRYPMEDAAKFHYVSNGFDTDPVAGSSPAMRYPVLLTYVGTVYGSTDPRTFIEAVLALPDNLRARLKVRYIGHIETDAYRASLQRLGQTIELNGFMPQAKALAAITETDYLLLISHDRINVAAKFYDYLAGGKPILAAVHPDGEVRRLLEDTGAGKWADVGDVSAILALLIELLSSQDKAADTRTERGREPVRDPERIAAYHRRFLTARYASLIRELVARARADTNPVPPAT